MNAKKSELAKLKQQIESYQNEHLTPDNGNEFYADSQPTTFDDIERPSNKRTRDHMSDTSGDDDIQEVIIFSFINRFFYLINLRFQ